jgi:ribonuclease P protein subunit RPR2
MVNRSRNPGARRIARERIAVLFSEAERWHRSHPERSDRYVALARRIAMRQRVRITGDFARRYCRHCESYLVPGVNMRVRIRSGRVVVTCLTCRRQRRYPLYIRGKSDG